MVRNVKIVKFNFRGLYVRESDSLDIHDFYIQDAGFESNGYRGGNIWLDRVTNRPQYADYFGWHARNPIGGKDSYCRLERRNSSRPDTYREIRSLYDSK
jgi:hypothetical protein